MDQNPKLWTWDLGHVIWDSEPRTQNFESSAQDLD